MSNNHVHSMFQPLLKSLANTLDLKAERDNTEHHFSMHRETCKECVDKSVEEIAAGFGCETGRSRSEKYLDASRRLRRA